MRTTPIVATEVLLGHTPSQIATFNANPYQRVFDIFLTEVNGKTDTDGSKTNKGTGAVV
jgi:hypothetical protein